MATGGAGDVLTGAVAGLIAQNPRCAERHAAGCLHASVWRAISRTAARQSGCIAGDIAEALPAALLEIATVKTEKKINPRLRFTGLKAIKDSKVDVILSFDQRRLL